MGTVYNQKKIGNRYLSPISQNGNGYLSPISHYAVIFSRPKYLS